MTMDEPRYEGILCIGDPHLTSRVPGFRRDDAPRTFLRKLAWCLDRAREDRLLPVILGDLFDLPRDNANWLLGDLLALLARREVLAIAGNHDCRENQLLDDDSLSVVHKAGRLRLLDRDGPWCGRIGPRFVILGGTSWGRRLPEAFDPLDGAQGALSDQKAGAAAGAAGAPLVLWMTHHDILIPGYEEGGRFRPREIPGIDVVVNGHIHRHLEDVRAGRTLWITPGNIARIARSDASQAHRPSVLRLDPEAEAEAEGFRRTAIEVPHEPYEVVFHPELAVEEAAAADSAFVRGLAELQTRRTQSGAGLLEFLEANLDRFEDPVRKEIRALAMEVTEHGR